MARTKATATASVSSITGGSTTVLISPPNLRIAAFTCAGTAPLMISRFAARDQMVESQRAGSQAKSKKKRDPKDFEALFEAAAHRSPDGWYGIHAAAFRNAMISACRLVNYKMTIGKLTLHVVRDGFDRADNTPLIRIIGPAPTMDLRPARNASGGMDIRARPIWTEWGCVVRIQYDADHFGLQDVTNLLARAGAQVGVGEGRPDSRMSPGMGFGTFAIDGAT